jgi:hypothetical protein
MSKFTFKKEPKETGLASIGNPNSNTIIKLNKHEVGIISGPNWASKDNLWCVQLKKKKESSWDWTILKQKFENEPQARIYLNENFERIFKIGLFEDKD